MKSVRSSGAPSPDQNRSYTGRFAPSPSGALHFGSLLAALASYLDARAHKGQWLVRMEDLDPDREPPGAADQILSTLEAFGLHWDGPVIYQSNRHDAYHQALSDLHRAGLLYPCDCSRRRVRELGGIYDGLCRHKQPQLMDDHALRVRVSTENTVVNDIIQGTCSQHLQTHCGDFIVRRRDGLTAYQLAVVVDDAWQQITRVVRGYDLLESTPRQFYLQQLLRLPHPEYAHIPVASNSQGQKLSKQHFARPLSQSEARDSIFQALLFLGQHPPAAMLTSPPEEQLRWAISHWDIQQVPKLANIPVSTRLS